MIRILLADDHAIVRNGLRQIMSGTTDIVVAGEATNGEEVLEIVPKVEFDLLVLDLNMPGMNGIDSVRKLLVKYPSLRILVLSMHSASHIVSRAIQVGVRGYMTKDSDQEMLISAIRKVAAGGRFVDPALVDGVVFDNAGDDAPPHELLSARELQVLKMLSAGLSIVDIAASLHLSDRTISTHKTRLMQKLNIPNNAELVRYATRHGLTAE